MRITMATGKLEKRVVSLEAEVAQLKRQTATVSMDSPWWNRIRGRYRDDSAYDEAMKLGRDFRNTAPRDGNVA